MRLTESMRNRIASEFSKVALPDVEIPSEAEVAALIKASIPANIWEIWIMQNNSEYLSLENDVKIRLTPGDTNRSWYGDDIWALRLPESLPVTRQAGYHYIEYSDVTLDIVSRYNAYEKRKADRVDLHERIKTALRAFSTTKQVIEALPELSPYVPSDASTAMLPIQNYECLRRELQSLVAGK